MSAGALTVAVVFGAGGVVAGVVGSGHMIDFEGVECMAQVISAEEGALRRGAEAVSEAKAGVEREVKKVRGEIEQVRSFWTGSAAVAFTSLMTTWDQRTIELNNVLLTLEDALRGTERDQAATEEEHQATISGLGSMMSGA